MKTPSLFTVAVSGLQATPLNRPVPVKVLQPKRQRLEPLPKYYGKTEFADGHSVWLQSFEPVGRTTASHYTLVETDCGFGAPLLTDFSDADEAFAALAERQAAAVMDAE
jgi:hypothetical protein